MNYVISGKVVRGDGYGRKLGYPTANLQTDDKLPPAGVYAGAAVLENNEIYHAGILINPDGKVEAHLLGFDGDLYDKELTLEAKKFLRGYQKFETEEKLIKQIEEDLKKC